MYMRIAWFLAGFHLIECIITPFTGFYYIITEENRYQYGTGILCSYLLPVYVYGIITILTLQFRNVLRPRIIAILLSYVLIPIWGQIFQISFYGVISINPFITLSIVFMFFNIQLDKDIQHKKDKEQLEEANLKIMLNQIQPHFLYNTLAAIRGLCETNPTMAKELINDFTIFLRANMDSLTNNRLIPFEQELLHVKSYLNLVQQLYGEQLKVEYHIQTTNFFVPTLSLQPIVENAVLKGIRKNKNGGTILICTEEHMEYVIILISDNGTGFDMSVLTEQGHLGIQNVKKRLLAMCNGTLIIDSVLGKGTTVSITIPKFSEDNSK